MATPDSENPARGLAPDTSATSSPLTRQAGTSVLVENDANLGPVVLARAAGS